MSYSTGLGAYYMIESTNGFGIVSFERPGMTGQRGQPIYANARPGARQGIAIPKRPGGTIYRGGKAMRGLGQAVARPPLYQYGAGAGPFMHGYGAYGTAFGDAGSVCADWAAGGDATNPDVAAGQRAAKAIQQALNDQGYGPIPVDGQFFDQSLAAWNRFAAAKGQKTDWPDCAGITVLMGGAGGSSKASMALGLGLLALLAVGAAALLAKKKHGAKHHGHGSSGTERITIEEHRS